ncbi:MAG: alpha-amylase family glycosyl hydrolase, partial [Spirochaetota bacterium]
MKDKLRRLWNDLYKGKYEDKFVKLMNILDKDTGKIDYLPEDPHWYKKGAIYSMYVDMFANNFDETINKLDYLKELGITAIWLLPILESPLNDQGFDISDYYKVREDLGGNEAFSHFIEAAHKRKIKIIFDIAINHSSCEHKWFKSAKSSKNSEYRDYYIWNEDTEKYKEARLLFKGIINSNWTYNKETDDYYFHRFYPIQPDLNYKNPDVLIEMIKALAFWKLFGVDGFRLDAAPFLWKEENTKCENLWETHLILKLFRASLDYIGAGTLLIAEANLMPEYLIEYYGKDDECQASYHFPLMPNFYLAIAESEPKHIINTPFPDIPDNCQWLTFLRCHDEVTLEFTPIEDREKMIKYYLRDNLWVFREQEGISGRLYDLIDKDYRKVLLAYSPLFSMEGTPIIYYGDEIGMENDINFYNFMIHKT